MIRFEPQCMPMIYSCLGNVPFTYFNLMIHPINSLSNSSKLELELFESFTKILICVLIFYFDCNSFLNSCCYTLLMMKYFCLKVYLFEILGI